MRLLLDPRARRALFGSWCLGWALVLVESLRPMPEIPLGLSDKLAHFAGYAAMAAGIAGFAHRPREIARWALLAVAMGGLIEVAQGFTPTRSPDPLDFLANTAGVAVGAAVAISWGALVIAPLRRRLAAA